MDETGTSFCGARLAIGDGRPLSYADYGKQHFGSSNELKAHELPMIQWKQSKHYKKKEKQRGTTCFMLLEKRKHGT